MSEPELAAFDAVYQRELSYVWKTAGRFGVPPGDIADVVHDVFVVLYRNWAEIDHARPLRPWLFGVARRIAANRRRANRIEPDAAASPDPVGDDTHLLARRDLLWRLLARLDDDRLEVVILHDLEGHSAGDIAAYLAISVNTVHSRLRLARRDLEAALTRLGERR